MMDAHPPEGAPGVEAEELARFVPTPPAPEPTDYRLRQLRGVVIGEIRAQQPHRRRRLIVAAVALGAAAAALFAGVTLGTESGSHRPQASKTLFPSPIGSTMPSPTPYPTNAAGQTYGGAQEGAVADLQAVVAERGENGYCWASDLDGPLPVSLEEAAWIDPMTQKRREVAVYESDGVTQVGVYSGGSTKVVEQPPVWLFDQMKDMATNAGDASAWAWWTRTTAEKAALATGNSTAGMSDLERTVYFAVILGDFTHWLWSLPEGTSAPEYSWIYEVIDAGSHEVDVTGASAKPFDAAKRLDMNIVNLRDRIRR